MYTNLLDKYSYRYVDVKHCARCGSDHLKLEFRPFKLVPIGDSDGTLWNYWAMCPITREPVLLKIVDDGK